MNSLRITTSTGITVFAPDRALVARTVTGASRPGDVVVLDGDADGDSPFLQAMRLETGWRVEVWRVGADHYRTTAAEDEDVVDLFWSWATGTDRWQNRRWDVALAA